MAQLSCTTSLRAFGARPALRAQQARRNVRVAAAAGMPLPPNDHRAVRKFLDALQWGQGWVDLVAEQVARRQVSLDTIQCEKSIEYLTSLGLTQQEVCNMVSKARAGILAADVETKMKPVVEYIKAKGANVKKVLTAHPKLLEYDVLPDNAGLQKNPRAFAKVYVMKLGDKDSWNVQYYRDDTAFDTAPVAPITPR